MADNYLYIDDNGKEQEGTLAGGTGITVAFNGTTRTETITNAGVTHVNSIAGDVTLAAGTGITITPSGSTLTFDATASGSYVNLQTGTLTAQNGSADITGQGTNPGLVVSCQSGYAQIHVVPGSSSLSVSPSDGDIMTLSDGSLYARLQSVWAQVSIPQRTSFPVGYAAGYQVQRTDLGYATFEYDGAAWNQLTIPSGTAFPGSPITNFRFYRTDLGLEAYYDGTRWLGPPSYMTLSAYPGAVRPLTATNPDVMGAGKPEPGQVYIIKLVISWSNTGTLNASNYWTFQLQKYTSAGVKSAIGSPINLYQTGRTSNTAYIDTQTVNTVYDDTTMAIAAVDFTKTGASGNLYYQNCALVFRQVLT